MSTLAEYVLAAGIGGLFGALATLVCVWPDRRRIAFVADFADEMQRETRPGKGKRRRTGTPAAPTTTTATTPRLVRTGPDTWTVAYGAHPAGKRE